MDARVYLLVIVVLAALLVYFLLLAPGATYRKTTTTTTVPVFSQNTTTTVNSIVNQTTNSSQNFSASKVGWVGTTPYLTQIGQEKCVYYENYTYCIGGTTNSNYISSAFFAKVMGTGLGLWTETIPLQIVPEGCILYTDEVYCITGHLLSDYDTINTTYYAYANSTGLSNWNQTTNYPINATTRGCVASGIIVYCVGGIFGGNHTMTDNSYYAPISGSGIGKWSQTIPFPIKADPQCYVYDYTIYCMGSYVNANGVVASYAYYAPITIYGMDSWRSTAPPPNFQGYISCNYYSPFVYCLGGLNSKDYNETPIYYTGLSMGGVNGWHEAPGYPISNASASSCITTNSTTFCIGGQTSNTSYVDNVYYTRSFI